MSSKLKACLILFPHRLKLACFLFEKHFQKKRLERNVNWKRKLPLDYDAITSTFIVLVWQIMLFNWKEISEKRLNKRVFQKMTIGCVLADKYDLKRKWFCLWDFCFWSGIKQIKKILRLLKAGRPYRFHIR